MLKYGSAKHGTIKFQLSEKLTAVTYNETGDVSHRERLTIYTPLYSKLSYGQHDIDDIVQAQISQLEDRCELLEEEGSGWSIESTSTVGIEIVKGNPIRAGYHLPEEVLINQCNVLNIKLVKDCFPMSIAYICFKEELKDNYLLNINYDSSKDYHQWLESGDTPKLDDLSKRQREVFKKYLTNPATYKKYLKRFDISPLSGGEVTFEEMAAFVDANKKYKQKINVFEGGTSDLVKIFSYGSTSDDWTTADLLLLHGEDLNGDSASHVFVIKDIEKFVQRNYDKVTKANTYVCTNCHVTFCSAQVWDNHMKMCVRNEYTMISVPKNDDALLQYEEGNSVYPHHIYICADFEAVCAPIENEPSCEEGCGLPTCVHRKSLREVLMEVSAYSWHAVDLTGKIIDSDHYTGACCIYIIIYIIFLKIAATHLHTYAFLTYYTCIFIFCR